VPKTREQKENKKSKAANDSSRQASKNVKADFCFLNSSASTSEKAQAPP
jgi:hypothetical protein